MSCCGVLCVGLCLVVVCCGVDVGVGVDVADVRVECIWQVRGVTCSHTRIQHRAYHYYLNFAKIR